LLFKGLPVALENMDCCAGSCSTLPCHLSGYRRHTRHTEDDRPDKPCHTLLTAAFDEKPAPGRISNNKHHVQASGFYQVHLERVGGAQLGLTVRFAATVDEEASHSVIVEQIVPNSAAAQWNTNCREGQVICCGDHIVAANGISTHAGAIMNELKTKKFVVLSIVSRSAARSEEMSANAEWTRFPCKQISVPKFVGTTRVVGTPIGPPPGLEPLGRKLTHTFESLLARTEGQQLGVVLMFPFSAGRPVDEVVVSEVLPGGAAEAWNTTCAHEHTILPGDQIHAVNGIAGNAKYIIEQLKTHTTVSVSFSRRSLASSDQHWTPPGCTEPREHGGMLWNLPVWQEQRRKLDEGLGRLVKMESEICSPGSPASQSQGEVPMGIDCKVVGAESSRPLVFGTLFELSFPKCGDSSDDALAASSDASTTPAHSSIADIQDLWDSDSQVVDYEIAWQSFPALYTAH